MFFGRNNFSNRGLKHADVPVKQTTERTGNEDCLEVSCETKDEHADTSTGETDEENRFAAKDVRLEISERTGCRVMLGKILTSRPHNTA